MKATASLGIASTDAFGYDLDTLMRRADMAVYAAKRAGRNRVVVATVGRRRSMGAVLPLRAAEVAAAHDTVVAHGDPEGGADDGSGDGRRL